jgi:alpha-D-ribose 1-methylphosphonate 5-triphosphate diphosphatase PhnM
MDTSYWELKSSTAGTGLGLALCLASFTSSGHIVLLLWVRTEMSQMLAFQPLYEILGASVKKSKNLSLHSDWSECQVGSSAANGLRISDWPTTGMHARQRALSVGKS